MCCGAGMGLIRHTGFLVLSAGLVITGNVSAGSADACKDGSANVERHASALRDKANRTTSSVISSVQSSQARQREQLALQMKIDALRTQLGATTEASQRATLSQQIRQPEKERAGLK